MKDYKLKFGWLLATVSIAALAASCSKPVRPATPMAPHLIVEGYPLDVAQMLSTRNRELNDASNGGSGNHLFFVIIKDKHRWIPGHTVRVAFSGGNPALYAQIEKAATAWTQPGYANLNLQFRNPDGSYITWKSTDNNYAGDVRVAFEGGPQGGYWSMVGTDSRDPNVGGLPGRSSLNLEGFDKRLPPDWEAITIHEFGHALGFEHEHQSPGSTCDFRFEDDAGYIKTKDKDGWYTVDYSGRRPGLYTYLGGFPNEWSRDQVDLNLRKLVNSRAFDYGSFDKLSIMKYFFDPFMFVAGNKSPCYTGAENVVISAQDKAGVSNAYSSDNATAMAELADRSKVLSDVAKTPSLSPELRRSITTASARVSKAIK